jgi:hypothetical protein
MAAKERYSISPRTRRISISYPGSLDPEGTCQHTIRYDPSMRLESDERSGINPGSNWEHWASCMCEFASLVPEEKGRSVLLITPPSET